MRPPTGPDVVNYFSINRANGQIKVAKTLDYDINSRRVHVLT